MVGVGPPALSLDETVVGLCNTVAAYDPERTASVIGQRERLLVVVGSPYKESFPDFGCRNFACSFICHA